MRYLVMHVGSDSDLFYRSRPLSEWEALVVAAELRRHVGGSGVGPFVVLMDRQDGGEPEHRARA